MTLGQKLRKARIEKGLTQSQAAGDRITRNMLSQIENDLASPSVKTLEYLAQTLGVRAGWLLADEKEEQLAATLEQAKRLWQDGAWRACLQELSKSEPSDEAFALQTDAALRLSQQALDEERFHEARELALAAQKWNEAGAYRSQAQHLRAAAVLARCAQQTKDGAEDAVGAYREAYLRAQNGVAYHLLMARYQLEQEHVQAAEREIWSIADLPEQSRAEYLILRGRIAAQKEQFENAIVYLQQAEGAGELPRILRRELYRCMEICCRESGDFKAAYEYAAKQIALNEAPTE